MTVPAFERAAAARPFVVFARPFVVKAGKMVQHARAYHILRTHLFAALSGLEPAEEIDDGRQSKAGARPFVLLVQD